MRPGAALVSGLVGACTLTAGAGLGLVGGAGAAVLPGPLGLGRRPVRETGATTAMTVTWYTLGGIAAGAAYRRLTGVG